jgi:hypothetical protein
MLPPSGQPENAWVNSQTPANGTSEVIQRRQDLSPRPSENSPGRLDLDQLSGLSEAQQYCCCLPTRHHSESIDLRPPGHGRPLFMPVLWSIHAKGISLPELRCREVERVEAAPTRRQVRVICVECGGPLRDREGMFVLKYSRRHYRQPTRENVRPFRRPG